MKQNMSSLDRNVRWIVAVVIAALYFTGTISGTLGIVLLAAAAIFVVTGLVKICPLYSIFGISTCSTK
jgi:hypothetical protein